MNKEQLIAKAGELGIEVEEKDTVKTLTEKIKSLVSATQQNEPAKKAPVATRRLQFKGKMIEKGMKVECSESELKSLKEKGLVK